MVVTFDQCDISTQVQHTQIKAKLPLSTLHMHLQPLVTTVLHSEPFVCMVCVQTLR